MDDDDINANQGRNRPATELEQRFIIGFAILILLMTMVGCSVLAAIDSTVVLKDIHIPPPGEYTICTKVTLTDGYAESLAKSSKMCGGLHWECAHIGPVGGMELIAPAPTSFNDRTAIFLLGHGLLHNLGGTHE